MVWPAIISGAIGLGSAYLGNRSNSKLAKSAQEAQAAANIPRNFITPIGVSRYQPNGNSIDLELGAPLQGMADQLQGLRGPLFGMLNDPNFVQSEVDRLRGIARPNEDALRSSLRSQIFNRGRLGLGVGGGVTGNAYNPELAALEEGLARADMGRVNQARGEQQRLLGNLFGLMGEEQNILNMPTQLAALAQGGTLPGYQGGNAQMLGLQSQMGFNSGFYGELGQGLSGLLGGLFGDSQGGYVPPVSNPGDYSLPYF